MNRITRRALLGFTGAAGIVAARRIGDRYGLIPPDHYGLFGVGETLTYASQRILTSGSSLAREFPRDQISQVTPVFGKPPKIATYQKLLADRFDDWRLTIDGLVSRPLHLSLTELRQLPQQTQVTHLACEEGWSYIAEWTGVPLSHILHLAGASERAKYVVFLPFDRAWESIDMADALHSQTILAHGMNGAALPLDHGAPVRLRVPRQLGYKSVKYLRHITVTDNIRAFGRGLGGSNPEDGYSWFAGI